MRIKKIYHPHKESPKNIIILFFHDTPHKKQTNQTIFISIFALYLLKITQQQTKNYLNKKQPPSKGHKK